MKERDWQASDSERADREAAEWVSKKIRGFTPSEQDAFLDWLAADPDHGDWYARHMGNWKRLRRLAQWMPEHSDEPNQDLLKGRSQRFRWGWLGGVAAILLLGFIIWREQRFVPPSEERVQEPAQPSDFVASGYERIELSDGSVVELNDGAAVKVDYTQEFRRVKLVSSEAHFQVAKDPSRPFVVSAKGIEIRAVGTAFNVRLGDRELEVLVTEGVVDVAPEPPVGELPPLPGGANVVASRLEVGQLSRVTFEDQAPPSVEVEQATEDEMQELLVWKRVLDFSATPLSEVIEAVNRRTPTQLEIADRELEGLPVVATFRQDNLEYFVELLELTMDIRAERVGKDRIRLHKE